MTVRDFKRKFKALARAAQSEDDRPTTFHLRFTKDGIKCLIRSNKKTLFRYPESYRPRLQMAETMTYTVKEVRRLFNRRMAESSHRDEWTLGEHGFVV